MKNLFKVLGILALAAAVGFGILACGGDDPILTLEPGVATVAQGATQSFKVIQDGKALGTSSVVIWSVKGADTPAVELKSWIDSEGKLYVGADEANKTLTVNAQLLDNKSVTAKATVYVEAAGTPGPGPGPSTPITFTVKVINDSGSGSSITALAFDPVLSFSPVFSPIADGNDATFTFTDVTISGSLKITVTCDLGSGNEDKDVTITSVVNGKDYEVTLDASDLTDTTP